MVEGAADNLGAADGMIMRGVNDRNFDDDELEFLKAMDRYKRDHHRPHPTWHEVLDVLRSLGWRPPERPAGLPKQDENHGSEDSD